MKKIKGLLAVLLSCALAIGAINIINPNSSLEILKFAARIIDGF